MTLSVGAESIAALRHALGKNERLLQLAALEVAYGTDSGTSLAGFDFDEVVVTLNGSAPDDLTKEITASLNVAGTLLNAGAGTVSLATPAAGASGIGTVGANILTSAGTITAQVSSVPWPTPLSALKLGELLAAPDVAQSFNINDNAPPDTTVDSGPNSPTNSTSATFTFSGTDNVAGTAGSVIEGNFIGTDLAGALSLGNANWGIAVFASGATIGVVGSAAVAASVMERWPSTTTAPAMAPMARARRR